MHTEASLTHSLSLSLGSFSQLHKSTATFDLPADGALFLARESPLFLSLRFVVVEKKRAHSSRFA